MKLDLRFLIVWSLLGVVTGAGVAQLSSGFGFAFPSTDAFLATSLVAIGLAIYAATFPIFRYRRELEKGTSGAVKRPDPLRSFRLLVLARAVLITALGFAGWHLGQLLWLWLFSIAPQGLVSWASIGLVSSVLMYLGGLGAQYNCRLPKDPDRDSA
jgi:hypothetical protein